MLYNVIVLSQPCYDLFEKMVNMIQTNIANVSITPIIIANLAYMNIKKHGELLELNLYVDDM